jgi:hypothetical protein
MSMAIVSTATQTFVIPAKAGTQGVAHDRRADWVPAFAGMTNEGVKMHVRGAAL